MDIKTKFNVEDKVFAFIKGNIIQQDIIEINIRKIGSGNVSISYKLVGGIDFEEKALFKDKQELIDYINTL